METLKPSNVFLAMTMDTVKTTDMTFERFRALIDTWAQIRELEIMATQERNQKRIQQVLDSWTQQPVDAIIMPLEKSTPKSTPADAEKVHVDDVEKVHPEGVEKVHAETPGEGVQSGPPEAPARDPSEIGKQSFATRKRNVLARIEAYRAAGGTMQEVADAAPGLTISSVMDAIARKSLPLTVWTQLEKAMKKLEARLPDGPLPGN